MTNPLATEKLQQAAEGGDLAGVRAALQAGDDPMANDSLALPQAAKYGHLGIVELILPVTDQKTRWSWALSLAAEHGHRAIVKLLLPVSDPQTRNSCALRLAAELGHHAIVELLLLGSDPHARDFLRCAKRRNTVALPSSSS